MFKKTILLSISMLSMLYGMREDKQPSTLTTFKQIIKAENLETLLHKLPKELIAELEIYLKSSVDFPLPVILKLLQFYLPARPTDFYSTISFRQKFIQVLESFRTLLIFCRKLEPFLNDPLFYVQFHETVDQQEYCNVSPLYLTVKFGNGTIPAIAGLQLYLEKYSYTAEEVTRYDSIHNLIFKLIETGDFEGLKIFFASPLLPTLKVSESDRAKHIQFALDYAKKNKNYDNTQAIEFLTSLLEAHSKL